jgi:hypothetical protein
MYRSSIFNLQSAIKNSKSPRRAHALPLAGGKGQLQDVDQLTVEQVVDDVVDGSEEPICPGSTRDLIIQFSRDSTFADSWATVLSY